MSTSKEEEQTNSHSDQDKDFAEISYKEFQNKNYSACLENILKLESRKDDFKVQHNKYVAQFYKGHLKTSEFQTNVSSLLQEFNLDIDILDDVEYCFAYFNIGILYYHQQKYTKALKIIERIYKFIEPLDESLGRQVGLLLIELHINVRHIDKALTLITYFYNQISNQSLLHKDEKTPTKSKDVKEGKSKTNDEFLKLLERYRIKCNLLTHSLKAASSEIKVLHDKDCKDVEVLFLFANQLYIEGKFEESMKVLGKVPADVLKYKTSGESSNVLFYNNMGLIHHAMGKPNLACYYYQQALQEEKQLTVQSSDDLPLFAQGASKYHELMFNTGISLLHAKKPALAFDCLIIAVRKYHRNCRLWLRLAECCIQVHKMSNSADFDIQQKQKEIVVDVLGSRDTQKVILNTNLSKDKKYSTESQNFAVPVATLEFAILCLKNAEFLLESDLVTASPPLLLIPGASLPTSQTNSISSPSSVILPEDRNHLKNSILVAYAYVSLCIGDYITALEKATLLIKQPKLSGAHKLLAHMYAAESLVFMDRLTEAFDHLRIELFKDIGLECPSEDADDEIPVKTAPPATWFPDNHATAMATLQYNVAVVKTLKGQHDQAMSILNRLWQNQSTECKVPAQIIMLVLYIKLQLGHVDVAKNFIRQYTIHRKISS